MPQARFDLKHHHLREFESGYDNWASGGLFRRLEKLLLFWLDSPPIPVCGAGTAETSLARNLDVIIATTFAQLYAAYLEIQYEPKGGIFKDWMQ